MSNRLYVGNLSFHAQNETLREAFSKHGTVTDVHILTDRETGQSRGFGFVTMATAAEAEAAVASMNGVMLDGRPLKVSEAQERQTRGGGGGDRRGGGRW